MGQYVKIKKGEETFTLEYDRASIVRAENTGFKVGEFGETPMNDYYSLVKTSLYKNHSDMTDAEMKEFADFLLDEGYGMQNVTETLIEMYGKVFQMEGRKDKLFQVVSTPGMIHPALKK